MFRYNSSGSIFGLSLEDSMLGLDVGKIVKGSVQVHIYWNLVQLKVFPHSLGVA